METVKNTGSHGVDLDDGRWLGPGETAEEVSLNNQHNKVLVDAGFLTVVNETPAEAANEEDKADRPPAGNQRPAHHRPATGGEEK